MTKCVQYIAVEDIHTPDEVVRIVNGVMASILGKPWMYATEDECYLANRAEYPPKPGQPVTPLHFVKITFEETDTPERTD